jgi:predicted restriction endonuclease
MKSENIFQRQITVNMNKVLNAILIDAEKIKGFSKDQVNNFHNNLIQCASVLDIQELLVERWGYSADEAATYLFILMTAEVYD